MEHSAEGYIIFDTETDRMGILDAEDNVFDLHCGDVIKVLQDGKWIEARLEMKDSGEWYFVGEGLRPIKTDDRAKISL